MLKGTTKSGFCFEVSDSRLNDMELLELLAALDNGQPQCLPAVCEKILGPEQKKALYAHVRKGGVVPIDQITQEIEEILQSGGQGKN